MVETDSSKHFLGGICRNFKVYKSLGDLNWHLLVNNAAIAVEEICHPTN